MVLFSKNILFLFTIFCWTFNGAKGQIGSGNAQKIVAHGAVPKLISSGFLFTEGPAADAKGNVYFTDQPNDRIMKWSVDGTLSTFMEKTGRSNGLYFDHHGNLLACADEHNQLWKIDQNKNISVVIKDYEGKNLNGPNDLWVHPNGNIYFTDPYYKRDYWTSHDIQIEQHHVYYFNVALNKLSIAAENLVQPNGIIGSPNGKLLYVADINDKKTYVYTILPDGSLSNRKLFCAMGSDGMTIDRKGNVYLTGRGVTVFNKNGTQIMNIPINEPWTANVTFGGKKRDILFITASKSVYTLQMNVKGI